MEKRYKPKDAQYHSNRILGQLYDKVETVNFKPQYEEPFDKRILRAYSLDDDILKTVRQLKSKYDRKCVRFWLTTKSDGIRNLVNLCALQAPRR